MCDAQRNCYEAALNVLLQDKFDNLQFVKLVHGFPRLHKADLDADRGDHYGHAWIEGRCGLLEICVNLTPEVMTTKEIYYKAGQIDPKYVTTFTKEEALAKALKEGHSGPWTDEGDDRHAPNAKFAYFNKSENN
jgi:hypothetical protein